MIHVRRAGRLDAAAMAELLNAIILQGGTTALVNPVTGAEMAERIATPRSVWHVAEDETGTLKGFQWIEPHPDLPQQAVDIATFVRVGETGLGIGSALFSATKAAAIDMGYCLIDAVIRADNTGGLAYYQSRGFETIRHLPDMELADGTRVDKVWKRYKL
ncbi:MAG: GNAT family N-acetyltransferase [Sulfitobacter sp.]